MTVSNAHIWKSVAASARPASRSSEKNLHIGQTLKDLYSNGQMPATDGRFEQLLGELDSSEDRSERH
ncbi:hypothetical protein C8J38_101674 [Rhizobium sp. PP-WC-2G-219]|nr:hypothetical protein C8J38_101674 [Rhizobium sp. PP-WC-2G-219]